MVDYLKKEVDEIPVNPAFSETFLIRGNGLSDFTHGVFKYPCKYIPHIPRWFLKKYSNDITKKYGVLDPFVGSGTTLVESSLLNLPSYGIDVDPFCCLLAKVKTTRLTSNETETLEKITYRFGDRLTNASISDTRLEKFKPEFEGIEYWFSPKVSTELATIKYLINSYYEETSNLKIRDFLNIVLASIIRKVSYAEEQSPKPYISKKIKKKLLDTKEIFLGNLARYFNSITKFSTATTISSANIIGNDARDIDKSAIRNGKVHLAMTSPPYINAFDYVRSLKLENVWLDLVKPSDIPVLYDKQIGTEKISAKKYLLGNPKLGIPSLDKKLAEIYSLDKRRAYVVADFFIAMSNNLDEIYNTLTENGFYCIVIGDSKIKGVIIPTGKIFIKLAEAKRFKLVDNFSYIIRNKYLRIPRQGHGGFIVKDHILVFKK